MKKSNTKARVIACLITTASMVQMANAQWLTTGNPTATNTSILGATGANVNLRLFAGGAAAANERIRIVGSSGNVGIGTTAPTTKLHVVGTSRLQGATAIVGATTITGAATISGLTTTGTIKVTGGTPGLNKILRSDAVGLASWITNPVGTNTTNNVPKWNGTQLVTGSIVDNGNVGIGTTTPSNKLSVSGSVDFTVDSAIFTMPNWSPGYNTVIAGVFSSKGATLGPQIRFGNTSSKIFDIGMNGALGFNIEENDDARLTIKSGGNVGIGITAPEDKLHLNGALRIGFGNGFTFAQNASGHLDIDYKTGASVYSTLMTMNYTGGVAIGTHTVATGYQLTVAGKIICTELKVQLQPFPDYVFAKDYNLKTIDEVEQHIKTYNRLPGMPSACEIEENGMSVGEMQGKVVEKVEELTLYIIQQQKQIEELKALVNSLKN